MSAAPEPAVAAAEKGRSSMRHLAAVLCLSIMIAAAVTAGPLAQERSDESAVRAVIEESYVRGIHNERDPALIRKGFHPSFVMLIRSDEGVRTLAIEEWISSIEKARKENPAPPNEPVRSEIPAVDVAGSAAVARVEIYRGEKHLFTDYLSLYRFEGGWMIVGKIFHRYE